MTRAWYTFIFADGTQITCRGMDTHELYIEEQKHGILLRRVKVI